MAIQTIELPLREAGPERVAQRSASQREAERVVLVHGVSDKAETAVGFEQCEPPRPSDYERSDVYMKLALTNSLNTIKP